MATDITDVIAQAIANAHGTGDDMQAAAVTAAEAFAAGLHANENWKPASNVVDTLVVKLVLDTSEAEAAVSALEKRAASCKPTITHSHLVGAIVVGSPSRAQYAEAARKWADEVTSNFISGLPPLPELLLTLVAIDSGPQ